MILKVFSVFDSKLSTYDNPFYFTTEAAAIRAFSDQVNDQSGQGPFAKWSRHPEDYSLFIVGQFDDQLGKLQAQTPESLITASSLVDVKKTLAVV